MFKQLLSRNEKSQSVHSAGDRCFSAYYQERLTDREELILIPDQNKETGVFKHMTDAKP